MLKPILIAAVLIGSALPAPLLAKEKAPNTVTGDPNERICESITPVGSRIATKRFCGTRAEWADRRRQDREALERAQLSPCQMTHNSRGANGNGAQSC